MTHVIHHEGIFFEWSNVVGSPISYAMDRAEFEEWKRRRHRGVGAERIALEIERAATYGTSVMSGKVTAEEFCTPNFAGPEEQDISFDELIRTVHAWRAENGLPALGGLRR